MNEVALSLEAFVAYFKGLVRVQLHWASLSPATHAVRVAVVNQRQDFSGWHFPWYLDPAGQVVPVDSAEARPVCVDDIIKDWGHLGTRHREAIEGELMKLRSSHSPARLVLATHSLPEGGRLVMDGNHRLAGLRLESIDFEALELSLVGPLDPSILPDLKFWAQVELGE